MFWESTLDEIYYYFEIYKKSYEQIQKNEMLKKDYDSWLLGLYVKSSILSSLTKDNKYPEKPFGLKEEQKPMTLEEARRIEENKIRQYMSGGGRNGR